MKSEELQDLTASEPLTLEQEFEMQKSWQRDNDKCTFIVLHKEKYESTNNEVEAMIGDTNLFFATPHDRLCAEAEIMIAETWARGHKCGWEAILHMFLYGITYLGVREFVVKISLKNIPSIAMFLKMGFGEICKSEVFAEVTLGKMVDETWKLWIGNELGQFEINNPDNE